METVQLIFQKDKDYPITQERIVDIQDKKEKSALHYAASSRHPELVSFLLENKAQPNLHDEKGMTPLLIAAEGT